MIPVNEPLLDGNEKKYLAECIDSGWISSEGPFVARLEREFSARVGRKYGIAVCNGTAALDVAVAALGLGKGDEVVLPSFTIISCAAAIVRAGATPVVVDSDPLTWNMAVEQIESKLTARTKAIMVVHIYGLPVDMDPVLDLARKHSLYIIEDAAELIGQTYKGRPCGSFGDVSAFSFYPNKHITTGEGGMVTVNDERLANRCRELRNLCFIPPRRFVHEELGWNYRMTNLQAAVGVAQLERLDEFIAKKREIGALYNEMLSGIDVIQLPLPETGSSKNIYWVYGIVLGDKVRFDAQEAMKKMATVGVGTRPFFYPMHRQPVFRNNGLFHEVRLPVAERLGERGFYLPSGLALTKDQIVTVGMAVKTLFA
jgi:perosamine synthetase